MTGGSQSQALRGKGVAVSGQSCDEGLWVRHVSVLLQRNVRRVGVCADATQINGFVMNNRELLHGCI